MDIKNPVAGVENRVEFVYLFDATYSNPNGDPKSNVPRTDPYTGCGIVTPECIKRKIRDFIYKIAACGVKGYDLLIKPETILNHEFEKAHEVVGKDKNPRKSIEKAQQYMCENRFDARTFGGVMTTGEKEEEVEEDKEDKEDKEDNGSKTTGKNKKKGGKRKLGCGSVRGPLVVSFAVSVDPVEPEEIEITRVTVASEKEANERIEKNGYISGTFGSKWVVPYGLYRTHILFNPYTAKQTGFLKPDLDYVVQALCVMHEFDRSAARPEVNTKKLIAFEHSSPLGNAPSHRLFERIVIKQKDGVEHPRRFSDYDVVINRDGLPKGVKIHEIY